MMELTVGMTVGAIVLVGIGSAIVVAGHALPDRRTSASIVAATADAAERITSELCCAKSFTQRSATAVEFTVADRNNDAADELIRYEWSGTPGHALTRSYNAGPAVPVLDDVQQFALSYAYRTTTRSQTVQTETDAGETLLAYFDGWLSILVTPQYVVLSPTNWIAEYFTFSFPADAISPRITRVRLKVRAGTSSNTSYTVAIHRPQSSGSAIPQATPIGTPVTASNSTLDTSASWIEYTFTDVALSTSDTELVIVAKGTVWDTARVYYLYGALAPPDSTMAAWTSDGGNTWSPSSSNRHKYDAPFYVWGAYKTRTTTTTDVTRYFVAGVGIDLRAGPDSATRVKTQAQLLNTPEVPGP